MSFQWALIRSFLYIEIIVILHLVLCTASPKKWSSFLKSKYAGVYFLILVVVLLLFLLDAVQEVKQYEYHDGEMQENMQYFMAQSNFYVSGFALLCSLVIRRLILLISTQAQLIASLKDTSSTSTIAQSYLESKARSNKEIDDLKLKVQQLQTDLFMEAVVMIKMRQKVGRLTEEYTLLSVEHDKLQKKLTSFTKNGSDK